MQSKIEEKRKRAGLLKSPDDFNLESLFRRVADGLEEQEREENGLEDMDDSDMDDSDMGF